MPSWLPPVDEVTSDFPSEISRVWVRGRFFDWSGRPLTGVVGFRPSPPYLRLDSPKLLIAPVSFVTELDPDTGAFAVELPVTDDPNVTPKNFTYAVSDPLERPVHLTVPSDTPILDDPDDPLHGQRVLDLADVYESAQKKSFATVQVIRGAPGARGRGIESITYVSGDLVFAMSDGSAVSTPIPASAGDIGAVQEAIDTSLDVHEVDPLPHTAYDDLPSLAVLFENGLV